MSRVLIETFPRKQAQYVSLTFKTPPYSTNEIWRSVKGRNIKSKGYRDWIIAAGAELEAQKPACVPGAFVITIDLCSSCRLDVDNAIKTIVDLLRAHKVIEGDSKKYLRKVTCGHSEHAETTVMIVSTK